MRKTGETITIEGLRKLEKMEEKPKNWKKLVVKYLDTKFKLNGNSPEFLEALSIARKMGLVWSSKKKY